MVFCGMDKLFFCSNKLWTLAEQRDAMMMRRKSLVEAGDIAAVDAVDASIKDIDATIARGNHELQGLLDDGNADIARSAVRFIPRYDKGAVMRETADMRHLAFELLDWMQDIEYEFDDEFGDHIVATARELFEDDYPLYRDWLEREFSGG